MTADVSAVDVDVTEQRLRVRLSDGRSVEISLDSLWLHWLRDATESQRGHWHLEPGGFALFWDDLDDGVEVRHLLSLAPVA